MGTKFDAVAFMRKRRSEIDEEDKGLTLQERVIKTRRIVENSRLGRELKLRRLQPEDTTPIGADQDRTAATAK